MPEQPEVVVVGAGLAGLACALHLVRAGRDVVVLEASDAVGGQVRTDRVDAMSLDRGFQVHNTGYPEAQRVLDHGALDLRPLPAGALVRVGAKLHRIGDPRRLPTWAPTTVLAPIGSPRDKLLIAATAARAALQPVHKLLDAPEQSTYDALRARGLSPRVIERFFRPFLSGVFLEDRLDTSSRFFDLVWRSFTRGTQCVPSGGMQRIPEQLAQHLPAGTIRLGARVASVGPGAVRVDERLAPRVVVVATAAPAAAALLPGLKVPAMRAVTTLYHLADAAPTTSGAIVLDGEASGPVANSIVLTHSAPSYAPHHHLVASSVVSGQASEPEVRAHLSRLYGVDTGHWEHVRTYDVADALPDMSPPMGRFRRPVRLEQGLFVCGDHRDSGSIQGALVSGRRAAAAVLEELTA